jgi:RNA polymerase sigma factor (sigma-70 family)
MRAWSSLSSPWEFAGNGGAWPFHRLLDRQYSPNFHQVLSEKLVVRMAAATQSRLTQLDDERLARLVHKGDDSAFGVIYDRHHAALLAFCRHMVGNREDGEDALQQTFLRAHRALREHRAPDALRPWLFAIARNRCRTLIAARRPVAVPVDDVEPSYDGFSEDVARRADLRELVADLGRLPEDQRGALVLFELGGLDQGQIAGVIGCRPAKVKALVYQARTELMAERDARDTPCESIRTELAVASGGALRRGPLRRHLRLCDACRAYRELVAAQRVGLAALLPVEPTFLLKTTILAGLLGGGTSGLAGHGAGAAGGAAAAHGAGAASGGAAGSGAASSGAAGVGAASGGTAAGAGSSAAAGVAGFAVPTGAAGAGLGTAATIAAKVAVGAALAGAAVTGGVKAVDHGPSAPPPRLVEARVTITPTPTPTPIARARAAVTKTHVPAARPTATPTATKTATPASTPTSTPAPAPPATPAPRGRRARAITSGAGGRAVRLGTRARRRARVVSGQGEVTFTLAPDASASPTATPTPGAPAAPRPRPRRPRHRPRPVVTVTPAPTAAPHVVQHPRPRPRAVPSPTPSATSTPTPTP